MRTVSKLRSQYFKKERKKQVRPPLFTDKITHKVSLDLKCCLFSEYESNIWNMGILHNEYPPNFEFSNGST